MVNAFSFCIYGREQPKYHEGLLENIHLVSAYFPDWRVFVYVGSDTSPSYIQTLQTARNVVLRFTGIQGHKNSLHRFFAIDEPDVDLMMVRDADSRIHWKDRWAINRFLESGRKAHIVRDHRYHCIPILAGLWGLRKGVIEESIRDMVTAWTPTHQGSGAVNDPEGFGIDQNFLTVHVYPRITAHTLVHYSFNCFYSGEDAEQFPFEWSNDVYCGRVEGEDINPYQLSEVIKRNFVPTQPTSRALDFLPKK